MALAYLASPLATMPTDNCPHRDIAQILWTVRNLPAEPLDDFGRASYGAQSIDPPVSQH